MAARTTPAVVSIVERSTPVLSFGDALRADVATLGINPSRQEFYSTEGELLVGAQRRLATTDSLGITAGQPLTEDQARRVVAESNDYFARNPYYWFNPLEALLNTACRLLVAEGHGINYVGWSTNLQTSFGVSNEFKQRLAGEVKELVEALVPATPTQVPAPMSTPDIEIDDNGFLPRGVRVSGKREFAALLRRWHNQSQAKTIGDVGCFGGTACITVRLGDHDVVLNVDSKRSAVATYLDHVRRLGPDLPWRVVANNRGTVNKVVFSDDPADAAGWYQYLRTPLAQPGQL